MKTSVLVEALVTLCTESVNDSTSKILTNSYDTKRFESENDIAAIMNKAEEKRKRKARKRQ